MERHGGGEGQLGEIYGLGGGRGSAVRDGLGGKGGRVGLLATFLGSELGGCDSSAFFVGAFGFVGVRLLFLLERVVSYLVGG